MNAMAERIRLTQAPGPGSGQLHPGNPQHRMGVAMYKIVTHTTVRRTRSSVPCGEGPFSWKLIDNGRPTFYVDAGSFEGALGLAVGVLSLEPGTHASLSICDEHETVMSFIVKQDAGCWSLALEMP